MDAEGAALRKISNDAKKKKFRKRMNITGIAIIGKPTGKKTKKDSKMSLMDRLKNIKKGK